MIKKIFKTSVTLIATIIFLSITSCNITETKTEEVEQVEDTAEEVEKTESIKEGEYPDPIGYVSDFDNVIDKDYEDKTDTLIRDLEEKTTAEIAVLTIESLGGKTIDEYAFGLFNNWGIGKEDKNNGILLLVAEDGRKVRIEVGLGLEDVITNDIAKQIIDELIIPKFQEGNFNQGIYDCVVELSEYIKSTD